MFVETYELFASFMDNISCMLPSITFGDVNDE